MMSITYKYCVRSLVSFSFVLFLSISIFLPDKGASAQQLVCPQRAIEQITDETEGDSIDVALSGGGTRIAIRSEGGDEANSFQLLLFDTTVQTLTQITDLTDSGISSPSINFDGTRIAFDSSANITGGNPGEVTQIFLFDTTTGIFTQVTNGDESSSNPSINADGTKIAFESNANINGGNPDNNDDIYLFDTTTGIFTQITDDMNEDSDDSSINADGTKIAFESRANINGGNPNGVRQVYLFDTTTGIFTQITDDMIFGSGTPSINADGTRIAFDSRANINGGNPDNITQIYLFDTTTGVITQITNETDTNVFTSGPSINADGTRIAYDANSNINGNNPDNVTQLFLFDTNTDTLIQITNETSGGSDDPSISADGLRIAFDSSANINGGNPELNREVFLALCVDPETFRNIPTLSEWGLIAMAGVLGLVGFMAIRKRKAAI